MAIDCVHGPFVLCPCPSQMWLPITRALSIWTYCSYIYITTKLCFIWSISVNSSTFKFHVDSPFSPIIFSLPLLFPPSLPSVFSFFSYASPLTHHLSPTPLFMLFLFSFPITWWVVTQLLPWGNLCLSTPAEMERIQKSNSVTHHILLFPVRSQSVTVSLCQHRRCHDG